jgi:hypothetical protein
VATLCTHITSLFFLKRIASCLIDSFSGADQSVGLAKGRKKRFDIIVVYKLVLHAINLRVFFKKGGEILEMLRAVL